jgi:Sec-independent protein translocase protein (TatC)
MSAIAAPHVTTEGIGCGETLHASGQALRDRSMAAAVAVVYQRPRPPDDREPGRRPFLDHLEELRRRLVRASVTIGIGTLLAFTFIDRIVGFVLAPMRRTPPGTHLIYTQPGEDVLFQRTPATPS